jgi:hypothetical protein
LVGGSHRVCAWQRRMKVEEFFSSHR